MPSDSSSRISDIPIAAFGSRAHLEEKALASVCLNDLVLVLVNFVPFLRN